MKKQMEWLASLLIMISVFLVSCKKELKDFKFSYSIESVDNYRLMVTFNSDKTYRIEENNFYMDKFAKRQHPKITEGTMADEELTELKPLLSDCDFFQMKDSYGFEDEASDVTNGLMYQISFSSEGKEKFISIRYSENGNFSKPMARLIDFINTFLRKHKDA